MRKKEFIREKHWDERRPRYDLDFVEVHVSPGELDAFLRQHAEQYIRTHEIDETTYLIDRKRREQMSEEIYKAAAASLTDRQFQIFILRYKFGLLEVEIARQVGVIQPYVSNTLKVSHAKIRRTLNLEAKSKRGPRTSFKAKKKAPKQSKKTSKKPKKKS